MFVVKGQYFDSRHHRTKFTGIFSNVILQESFPNKDFKENWNCCLIDYDFQDDKEIWHEYSLRSARLVKVEY